MSAGIASRYATAVFELAREAGSLPELEADTAKLRAALAESADLRTLITSPLYSRDEQGRAMAALASHMELGTTSGNALALMARNRRLFVLPQFLSRVLALIAQDRGEITAEVRAAHPLSAEQSERLAAVLREATGKAVTIELSVDPALIGGLVVKVGSRMIDRSIAARLASLRNAMKEVG